MSTLTTKQKIELFKAQARQLNAAELRELFERMKADDTTDLGLLLWVSGEYGRRIRSTS